MPTQYKEYQLKLTHMKISSLSDTLEYRECLCMFFLWIFFFKQKEHFTHFFLIQFFDLNINESYAEHIYLNWNYKWNLRKTIAKI